MPAKKTFVDRTIKLEKFPGKGGWTFARLPNVLPDSANPFGWRRVRGTIDGVPIERYHLMPMGNGRLFLPVKAAIRKKIKKDVGDRIHVILFPDNPPTTPDKVVRDCLHSVPAAWDTFINLPAKERHRWLAWVDVSPESLREARLIEFSETMGKIRK